MTAVCAARQVGDAADGQLPLRAHGREPSDPRGRAQRPRPLQGDLRTRECVVVKARRRSADLVPFEKYAAAAEGLLKPSSVARAIAAGAPFVERVDRLAPLQRVGAASACRLRTLTRPWPSSTPNSPATARKRVNHGILASRLRAAMVPDCGPQSPHREINRAHASIFDAAANPQTPAPARPGYARARSGEQAGSVRSGAREQSPPPDTSAQDQAQHSAFRNACRRGD